MPMKKVRTLFIALASLLGIVSLSGCAINYFEEELNVVFKNEGEIVDSGVVSQFTNYQSPTLPESYIPEDFRFLGWTGYQESELDLSNVTNFRNQYISGGRMVHYMDVKKFAVNKTVTLNALIMHKDDIPKEYHYAVVAWYDKPATTGIVADQINTLQTNLKSYLLNNGVSESDVETLVFRSYSGNVGPTTGQILYDGDVDIMFGWGSLSNITTTGSIPEEMVLQSEAYQVTYQGELKTRYLHRLSDTDASKLVTQFILSDEARSIFN